MKTLLLLSSLAMSTYAEAAGLGCKLYFHQAIDTSLTSEKAADLKKFSKILNEKGYQIVRSAHQADVTATLVSYCAHAEKLKCLQSVATIEMTDKKTGEVGQFKGIESTLFLNASLSKATINALEAIEECK